MIVKAWRVFRDERSGGWPRLIVPAGNRHGPYPGRRLRDFEDDIKKNQTVTFAEDEQWISKMSAGDESPVIALLFPRLKYLTSLTVSLGDREDFFMLKTLQRMAKDPVSSSLSRLRQLDVRGKTIPSQRVRALLSFSALPSLVLLKAHWLAEGPLISAEKAYKLAPSSLRHLELVNCAFPKKTLTEVIKSAKWLHSLT